MADFDDFDFDLSSGFGDNDPFNQQGTPINQDSGQNQDDELGDFANANVDTGITQDKVAVIKTAAVVIVVGLIIVLLVFSFMRLFTGKKDKTPSESQDKTNTVQTTPNTNNNQTVQNSNNSNGWVEFSSSDGLTFNEDFIPATFTITNIKHYAKITDSEGNLEVKTVLTGSISGYGGTYEVEVPYYQGRLLKETSRFDIWVQVGKLNGKVVIGEISY